MGYLTELGVKAHFPQLAGQVTKGNVTTPRITVWLNQSDSLIDSYLSARFTLPFTAVPLRVTSLAYDVFEFYWQSASNTPPGTKEVMQWLKTRWNELIAQLESMRDGGTILYDSLGIQISPSSVKLGTIKSNHQEVDQIFSTKESWDQLLGSTYSDEPTF